MEILSSRETLLKGVCYKIGNGVTIRPWSDLWVPGTINHALKTKEGVDGSTVTYVAHLRSPNGDGWNMEMLHRLCDAATVDLIKKINWPTEAVHDKLLWKGSSGRSFSVKECYNLAH